MEVFQSSGEQGLLTVCLDGGETITLDFKSKVQVSVRFTSQCRENADHNIQEVKAEAHAVSEKVKEDLLDEELNGFIQRVKHSESGSLFPDSAETFFSESADSNVQLDGVTSHQKECMTAHYEDGGDHDFDDDTEKVSVFKTEQKSEPKIDDDDESTMDLEDDYGESMKLKKNNSDRGNDVKNVNQKGGYDSTVQGSALDADNAGGKEVALASSSTPTNDNNDAVVMGGECNGKSKETGSDKKEEKRKVAAPFDEKYARLRGPKVKTVYKCNICEKEFVDSYTLSIHQRAKNVKVMCSMCDLECMSKANLIIHERLMHSKNPKENGKQCPVCNRPFAKHSDILNHIRAEHTNEGLYCCCRCQTLYQTYQSFKEHLDSHKGIKPVTRQMSSNKLSIQGNQGKEKVVSAQANRTQSATRVSNKPVPKKPADMASSSSRQKPPTQLRSLMNFQVPGSTPKMTPKPNPKPIPTPSPKLMAKPIPKPLLKPIAKPVLKPLTPQMTSKLLDVKRNLASRQGNVRHVNLITLKRRLPIDTQSLLPIKKKPSQSMPSTMKLKPTNLLSRTKPSTVQLMRNRLALQSKATAAMQVAAAKLAARPKSKRNYNWDKLWKCHFCERVFRSKGEYINHKKPCRITQMCKECGFTSTSKALYLIHHYQKHTNRHNDRYTLVNEDLRCHMCEEPITLNEVLNHIMSKHTGEHPYECCVCKHSSMSYEEWVQHGKTHVRSKEEKASLMTSKLALNLTVKTAESEKTGRVFCNLCKEHFESNTHFIRHHKSVTKKRDCEVCQIICHTEAGYIIHKYISHGLSPGEGKETSTTLPSTSISGDFKMWQEDDTLNDNNEEITKCPCCHESFPMKDLLPHVMSTHTQESPYKCCVCKTLLSNLDQYIEHCDFHLGKKLYTRGTQRCMICSLRFDSRIRLSRHKYMHKPSCPYCQVEFNSKALLDVHLKNLHINDMTACEFCGKLFADNNQLAEHERNHYFYKKAQCPDCGVMVTNVTKHLARKHPNPNKQHLCNLCGQTFPMRCDLSRHLARHSSDRRHECDICKKTFKRSSGLRRHAQSHLQDRKYFECHICGKKCTQRNNLSVHMRVHATTKAFTCEHCGQGFNYNQSLQTHIRKKHTPGPPTATATESNLEIKTSPTATPVTISVPPNIMPSPDVPTVHTNTPPSTVPPPPPSTFQEHAAYPPGAAQHYYPDPASYINIPVNSFQRSYSDLINNIVRSEHEQPQGSQQQGYPVFYPQF